MSSEPLGVALFVEFAVDSYTNVSSESLISFSPTAEANLAAKKSAFVEGSLDFLVESLSVPSSMGDEVF